MARNIFISYKYKDDKVASFPLNTLMGITTIVRHYVDELQKILKEDDHINLGEKDGESLADFSDSAIETSLKDKIFQSSITLVIISKGMNDLTLEEKDQWIPWEVSYSLRSQTRRDRKSHKNAVLGVVLPDENNSYRWYYISNMDCNSVTHNTQQLFDIMKSNMFNLKEPSIRECNGTKIHERESSYIKTTKWEDFKTNSNDYIEKAIEIRDQADDYDIRINLT